MADLVHFHGMTRIQHRAVRRNRQQRTAHDLTHYGKRRIHSFGERLPNQVRLSQDPDLLDIRPCASVDSTSRDPRCFSRIRSEATTIVVSCATPSRYRCMKSQTVPPDHTVIAVPFLCETARHPYSCASVTQYIIWFRLILNDASVSFNNGNMASQDSDVSAQRIFCRSITEGIKRIDQPAWLVRTQNIGRGNKPHFRGRRMR